MKKTFATPPTETLLAYIVNCLELITLSVGADDFPLLHATINGRPAGAQLASRIGNIPLTLFEDLN